MMKLTAHKVTKNNNNLTILQPGTIQRQWMDDTPHKFAYRCLPLTMANSSGWEMRTPCEVVVDWDGSTAVSGLRVYHPDGFSLASSIFGSGIVTFHTGYQFKTSEGWGLWVMGPPNFFIDGVVPLTGVVETAWLPFTFTMNWKLTRPGRISFAPGDPICFVTFIPHKMMEEAETELIDISDAPIHKLKFERWADSRHNFIEKQKKHDPGAIKQKWQKNYHKGIEFPDTPDKMTGGQPTKKFHITKRNLPPFQE